MGFGGLVADARDCRPYAFSVQWFPVGAVVVVNFILSGW